jgi:hypothetical protein
MGDIRSRLASFSLSTSLLVLVGLAGGCGDNTPKMGSTGTGGGTGGMAGGEAGSGGEAGTGGLAGSDAGVGGLGGVDGSPDAANPDASVPCYTTAFTKPAANNANLTVTEDTDHNCTDGFQYTVEISSMAPDGTLVTLYDGNTVLRTATVMAGKASFDVQLSTGGTSQALSIQYPSTTACSVVTNVNVSCDTNAPTCSISKPSITATHPALNGVPAPAGDRTSSAGSSYQATFVVQTNAENGEPVTLVVDNAANPTVVSQPLTSLVSNGTATFSVTLTPDATYEVVATCNNKNGASGMSAKGTYVVDTTPPDLTVTKPTAGMFVVGGNVDVCGQTTQTDAAGLMSSLGAGQNNFCVSVGSAATPTCVPMAAVNSPSCVTIPCPGSAPFSLTVQLSDAAGNPTVQTLTGITCASSHPTVSIIAPDSDAPLFQDKTKHILAANAPTGVKDQDPATAGAQVDVVACTDVPGTAALTVGHVGDTTLNMIASVMTATAVAADNCPSTLPNVARFAGVTLPESNENADGTLAAATRLVVTVTSSANAANIGTSPADDVWVDTTPPNISLVSPAGLCGSFDQSATTVTNDLVFSTDTPLVVVDVTNGSSTTTYDTPALMSGSATFGSVAFAQGLNNVTVTASDAAGNATVLSPNPCAVTVGMAPVVTFTTPTAGAILCPANPPLPDTHHNPYHNPACVDDNDTTTAGWQGSLAVSVTVGGQPVTTGDLVTFTLAGNSLGTSNLDANGHAQIDHITIPDGVQTIIATTASIANSGVGIGSVTVTADTVPPNPPTGLSVVIKDRRATSMLMTWTAPSDAGGGNVAGYQVRYAKVPIDSTNFDPVPPAAAVTTPVTYSGAPANAGQLDTILVPGLFIENNYYFAVEAIDIAGTPSATILASPSSAPPCTCDTLCCAAHFNETTLAGTSSSSTEEFGFQLDGSGDVNNDGLSDVLVGSLNGQQAYLFFGTKGDFVPTAPSVVFSGDSTTKAFGAGIAQIGDIDGDGREDIAISDRRNPSRVFIYKGRDTWPATMTRTNADYTITVSSAYNGALFGLSMARLGDFNGDGIDDFAIGADQFNGNVGRVVIVLGSKTFGNIALPDTTNTITIDGDNTVTAPLFGYRVQGLGHFYSISSGTTLVVSAVGNGNGPGSEGRLYAYHGQSGTGGAITAAPDNILLGPAAGAHIGLALANLGPLMSSVPTLGSGNPLDTVTNPGASGNIFVFGSTADNGPFLNPVVISQTGGGRNGIAIVGGGVSGRNIAYSLIGDATPDVIMIPQTATKFNIMNGTDVLKLASPADSSTAAVSVSVPSGWGLTGEDQGSLIPDINGDGYSDFAVGNAANAIPGNVAVYW